MANPSSDELISYIKNAVPHHLKDHENIDLQHITQLLEEGADPNIVDRYGCNLLDYTVQIKNLDCLKLILSTDVKIQRSNICLAIKCNFIEGLKELLEHGTCPNLNDFDHKIVEIEDYTPLHVALSNKHLECFLLLLKFGIDPLINQRGNTILHTASRNVKCLREVLSLKIFPINITNTNGETPLYIATKYKQFDCMQLLILKGANPHFGLSPLLYAISNNDIESIKLLSPHIDYNTALNITEAPIFVAIRSIDSIYQESALQMLIELNVDLRARCSIQVIGIDQPINQCSVLSYSIIQKNTSALEKILTSCQDPSIIEFLVTATDSLKMTALHHACSMNNFKAIQLLIEHGSLLDAQDQFKRTPLHHACIKLNRCCIELLVKAIAIQPNSYAIINAKDNTGWTPLHRLARNKSLDCITLLVEYGADLFLENKGGMRASQLARKLKHVKIVNYLEDLENNMVEVKEPDIV
jgi:ankyrin repeat protein